MGNFLFSDNKNYTIENNTITYNEEFNKKISNEFAKKILSKYKLEQLENLLELDENLCYKMGLLVLKKKLEKNSTKINTETILSLLELFDLLNIPYIFSHGEGEYLAVLLNKYNIIDV